MNAPARKPRILWVGHWRVPGGISVVTDRFMTDERVHEKYTVRAQDQSFRGELNENILLKYLKIPRGISLILWNRLFFNPDIIHIHTAYQQGFLRDGIMALLAKALGKKVVITFHPGRSLVDSYHDAPRWLKRLTDAVLPRCDAVIALGETYAAFLREKYPRLNIHIIPNPVNDESIPAAAADYTQREKVVFFAGLLDGRKGALDVLRAAERVGLEDVRFIIKGQALTAADKANFRQLYDACTVKEKIQLEDWGNVFEHLQRARLLVLPSYGESLPIILEEALLCGLPVVTTPVGVIPDYIQDGVHGHLIPPGDVEALARAIRHVLQDEPWALEVSEHNRKYGRIFLRSRVHARLFRVYDELFRRATRSLSARPHLKTSGRM